MKVRITYRNADGRHWIHLAGKGGFPPAWMRAYGGVGFIRGYCGVQSKRGATLLPLEQALRIMRRIAESHRPCGDYGMYGLQIERA